MPPSTNIRSAGADRAAAVVASPGGRLARAAARLVAPLLVVLVATSLGLGLPVGARASLSSDLKSLPADTSPKQACRVMLRNDAIRSGQEGRCRRLVAKGFTAAKTVSDSGSVTIASAAACAIQALRGNLPGRQMGRCARRVAASAPGSGGGGGGGGFDPLGAASGAVGAATGGVGDVVGGVGDAIGGAVTGTLLDGFKAIIDLLFGGLQSAITVALIKWIATIPNLSGGHVGNLQASVAVGAGGLLAATMTISIVRFWSSGLTGDGAWAGAEGVMRAAVAAALIGLWPQIFSLVIRLSNALQSGILSKGVQAQLKALFRDLDVIGIGGGALTGGLVPMFLAIVIAVVGILMLLALVAMKIVITTLTIVLFVAMPLALVLWPIPELAGIARFCLRTLAVATAIPVVWCLIFGSFAAIGADTFSFHNTGKDQGIFGTALNVTIVRPLVAIALLYLALVVPRRLLQVVPMFSGRTGAIRHIGTGMAVRAGFSYVPQAGRAALERAQTLRASAATARSAQTSGSGGSPGGGGSTGGRPTPTTGKEATEQGGSAKPTLRDKGTQASKRADGARGEAGTGKAQGQQGDAKADPAAGRSTGSGQAGANRAAERATAAGRNQGQALTPDQQEKAMERGDGPFGGPRTPQSSLTPERIEAINSRSRAMAADSASGTAVTRTQVDSAVNDLKARPGLLEAAKKAAYHGEPERVTGAFAEWSLTDNPHVGDQHRSAFGVLGRASPSQRRVALARVGDGGGSGAGTTEGGGRVVPKPEPRSIDPSPRRAPHSQPRRQGGS